MVTELAWPRNAALVVVSPEMQIDIVPEEQLEPVIGAPADRSPALVYLAGLSRSSQATQAHALAVIAAVLTAGRCTPLTLPWHSLGDGQTDGDGFAPRRTY
jgi:hypothetical protein